MKVTEQPSRYSNLEHTPTKLLLEEINREDHDRLIEDFMQEISSEGGKA